MRKRLMLVGWNVAPSLSAEIAAGRYPRTDFYELAHRLQAEMVTFTELDQSNSWLVKVARSLGGSRLGLAVEGFRRRHDFDLVFTTGEDIGLPLATLLKLTGTKRKHLMIGHRLSPPKKALLWRWLRLHTHISKVFVYSKTQREIATNQLGTPTEAVVQIPFMADQKFFHPMPEVAEKHQVCAVGLEWRDYPTLIEAGRHLDCDIKIAAGSLWSKHKNEAEAQALPQNVDVRKYNYCELRMLYAESKIVVVPLYQNDFQAGITTILEAMAMGKALVLTRTMGQTDTVIDGETGLYVEPGDPADLRAKIDYLLQNDAARQQLGQNARRAFEAAFTLDHLVERIEASA